MINPITVNHDMSINLPLDNPTFLMINPITVNHDMSLNPPL